MHKIYSKVSENAEAVEIGIAKDVILTTETRVAPTMLHMGDRVTSSAGIDLRVYLYGYKTPQPPVFQGSNPRLTPIKSEEVTNLELMIAALVKMLGGAVVISVPEFEDARKLNLTAVQMEDMFIVNANEKPERNLP